MASSKLDIVLRRLYANGSPKVQKLHKENPRGVQAWSIRIIKLNLNYFNTVIEGVAYTEICLTFSIICSWTFQPPPFCQNCSATTWQEWYGVCLACCHIYFYFSQVPPAVLPAQILMAMVILLHQSENIPVFTEAWKGWFVYGCGVILGSNQSDCRFEWSDNTSLITWPQENHQYILLYTVLSCCNDW